VPTLPVTPVQIAVALGLTVIGCAIQGSVGIGYAVIVAPLLLLFAPAFVPGPIVVSALLLVMLIASRDRHAVIVRDIKYATVGRALGTIPAAYMLATLPRSVYELVFGALVMLGVVVSVGGLHIPATRKNVVLASILSGFMSAVSSIGGPPMALLYQHEEGPRIRATISAIFTIGGFITLAGLWWAGKFSVVELLLGVLLMPGVVVGFYLSKFTASRLDAAHARPALLIVSGLCAIVVIVRALATGL
jgi:uncharacterized membrane protein YfcA